LGFQIGVDEVGTLLGKGAVPRVLQKYVASTLATLHSLTLDYTRHLPAARCHKSRACIGLESVSHTASRAWLAHLTKISSNRAVGIRVDKVRKWPMLLKKSAVERSGRRDVEHADRCRVSGWHRLRRHRDELGKLSEVLGGGREVELVSGAVRAA
jgi:hypothetical protein